jgi:hypothetical protein
MAENMSRGGKHRSYSAAMIPMCLTLFCFPKGVSAIPVGIDSTAPPHSLCSFSQQGEGANEIMKHYYYIGNRREWCFISEKWHV